MPIDVKEDIGQDSAWVMDSAEIGDAFQLIFALNERGEYLAESDAGTRDPCPLIVVEIVLALFERAAH